MADLETEFSFGRVLTGWRWLLLRDARRLLPILLLWAGLSFVPIRIDEAIGISELFWMLSTSLFVDPIFFGMLYLLAIYADEAPMSSYFSRAISLYLPLLALHVLTSFGMVLGMFLFIFPGIALAVLWSLSFPILLNEDRGPIEAMGASFKAVRVYFWPIFGLFALFGLAMVAVNAIAFFVTPVGIETPSASGTFVDALLGASLATLGVYLSSAIYLELGYSGGHDASVFD